MNGRLMHSAGRSGTVLIIVAGISALLAGLALTFLVRMRSDVEESRFVIQYAQAKIMLAAGCNYIQESSRIGWDRTKDPSPPTSIPTVDGLKIHEEAFGWVDVRNGQTGPLNRAFQPLAPSVGADKWPNIGTFVRCPMFVRKIPPYATKLNTGFNPMLTQDPASADYCYPLLRYPDPQPVINNAWTHANPQNVSNTKYADYIKGDPTPIQSSLGKAWFRVFRDGPATFIITCGSGGTNGFKTWDEVVKENQTNYFGGPTNRATFDTYRASELRLYYRVEWSAAGIETSYHNLQHEVGTRVEHYESYPPNSSHTWSGSSRRTQTWIKSPVGTIRWIQRLNSEPTFW